MIPRESVSAQAQICTNTTLRHEVVTQTFQKQVKYHTELFHNDIYQPYSKESRDGGGRFALPVFRSRKVTIAAINGNAAGIGITMTLPMDLVRYELTQVYLKLLIHPTIP